jgi:RHS repeat-associated protein
VYEWNAENELARVTKNALEQARFKYDAEGRRAEKVAGGTTTSYMYDGPAVLREVRGGGTLKYVHGPLADEPLAVDDGSTPAYYHADALGSLVKAANAAGVVTLTHRYDAWGNPEVGATEPAYAFTGREWDPETGLHYYRARYYDPKAGRFVTEDPIGLRSRQTNFYAYVRDNPINLKDPSGLDPTICVAWNLDPFKRVTGYNWLAGYCDMLAACFTCNGTAFPTEVRIWVPFYKSTCPTRCGPFFLWRSGGKIPDFQAEGGGKKAVFPIVFCEW